MAITMNIIEITREPVELYKVLKFEGILPSGGEAKFVISEGLISLNGVIETRKRKKLVNGDVIEFNGEQYQLNLL